MLDILETEKSFILKHIKEGDTVADFTMGNGHDTLFFSKLVGVSGRVYAFDIQPAALESTKKRLVENQAPENYTLINDSHHNAKLYIDRPIKAGMFNLGYLPGSDKSVTTKRETPLPAIEAAIDLLDNDAILLIAVCGYFILMANRYVCPHCGTEFKAKPYDLSVTVHMMGKRLAKCPHCGKRSFCRIKR